MAVVTTVNASAKNGIISHALREIRPVLLKSFVELAARFAMGQIMQSHKEGSGKKSPDPAARQNVP